MSRIAGVDLPKSKQIAIALTYIYGISRTSAQQILSEAGVDFSRKADALSDQEVAKIQDIINQNYKVEGDLRKEISMNIKRLMDIGSYRGLRHRKGLPTRGQRTHTNARTRKGPRRATVGSKKKVAAK
ncbi:MAG: 30S ribosomal protein S13 [Proteobacteria bacterium]|nr:30S ribosomal protein S13 [Pseudomonadota bacterium]